MDFSDMSSYPIVANTDYSPTNDAFSFPDTLDKAYLADSYSTQPDYSLDSFFDRPVSSIEQHSRSAFNTTVPTTAAVSYPSTFTPATFQLPSDFSFSPLTTANSFDATYISPQEDASRTPSLCGDGPQLRPISPSASPRSVKRESPNDELSDLPSTLSTTEPTPRPVRKRGRPRLDRSDTNLTTSPPSSSPTSVSKVRQTTHRLPHNQVERKYREGLNSEMERLRRAVPTLPQCEEGSMMGQPKPSKAMVLAGAIEYIKKIEKERDEARREVERLRRAQGTF